MNHQCLLKQVSLLRLTTFFTVLPFCQNGAEEGHEKEAGQEGESWPAVLGGAWVWETLHQS